MFKTFSEYLFSIKAHNRRRIFIYISNNFEYRSENIIYITFKRIVIYKTISGI